MFEVSETIREALEESVSYSIFAKVVAEAELNGYVDYSISFPESVEPNLFPQDEVLKVRRPRGGLPKLITGEGRISDITIDSACYSKDRSWYRVPSKDSKYKYFRSKDRSSAGDGENFPFNTPQQFTVEYSDVIRPNHIVVGFEYSNSLPVEVQIELLQDGDWVNLGFFDVQDNGLVEIFYDGDWRMEYSDNYDADPCDGIRVTVEQMDRPDAALELIQISPRLTINVSDRVSTVNVSKSSQETSLANPIGTSSSNSAAIQLSNNDGFFDFYNEESIFAGLPDVNVRFIVSDIVGDEEIPQGQFFANSWDYTSDGRVTVDCSDYSKFLQSQAMENSFYVDKDLRFVIADIIERAGIVEYEICFAEKDLELNSPFYFFNDEETVWDALQQLAIAEQAFYYFDNLNRLVWVSRDYWWDSSEVDYVARARREEEKLANLIDYNHQFTIVANKATINYTPTKFLNNSSETLNNFYREQNLLPVYIRGQAEFNNTLWELSDDTVLVSSRLQSRIDDDSEYFFVDPAAYRFLPETGILIIDAEYIRYSKIPRLVGPVNRQRIEDLIQQRINQVNFTVEDAATRKSVSEEEVQVILVEDRVWPDASLGCPEPGVEYDDTAVEGFFIILRAGDFFLQYNGSGNGQPFLCGIADVTEEKENLSYWSIVSGEPVFNQGEGGIQIENALFIEERGAFNSAKRNHDIVPVEGGESFTFLQSPPVVVDPPNRLFADTYFENSKLKIRANRYDLNMVHHYSPNTEFDGEDDQSFDIYGAQLVFPATEIKDRAGNVIDFRYLSQGIAGIYVNQTEPGTGYYIELITSQYTNLTQGSLQNVRVWKYEEVEVPVFAFDGEDGETDGEELIQIGTELITVRKVMAGFLPENLFTLSLEQLQAVAGTRIAILPEREQSLSVYVQERLYNVREFMFDGEDGEDGEMDGEDEIPTFVMVGGQPFILPSSIDPEELDGEDPFLVRGIEIVVTVNGRRIFTTIDYEFGENEIYDSGKWGVFSRGSTDVDFEYIYAINRQGDRSELSKAQFAIRDQLRGGFIDNTLEHYLSEYNELRNIYFFDDFGAWAREVKEFDVQNEVWPAFNASLFISQEDRVFKVYQKLDQFSSKFALGSRVRGDASKGQFVVLTGDDATQGFSMATLVSGPPINRSETEILTKTNDKSIWRRGEEEVFVDSPWVQTKKQAERIADWILERWSAPAEVIEAQVMVDPRLEVGDLVALSVPENNITAENQLFHIASIEKTVGDSQAMSLSLRKANF
jgi:hypothetical protein